MEQADVDLLTGARGRAALAREASAVDAADPFARSAALRREGFSATETAVLLTQADLRRRAAAKFGEAASRMLLTRAGLEQATRLPIAAQHAERIRRAGFDAVADLGCGIGGDAMAFAAAGLAVDAVERDPVTAALARHNLAPFPRATVRTADAETATVADDAVVWLDPARRTAGHGDTRRVRPEDWSPSLDHVAAVLDRRAAGAKLAPGLDRDLIPAGVEAQWVSSDRETAELVLAELPADPDAVVLVGFGAVVVGPATLFTGLASWTLGDVETARRAFGYAADLVAPLGWRPWVDAARRCGRSLDGHDGGDLPLGLGGRPPLR